MKSWIHNNAEIAALYVVAIAITIFTFTSGCGPSAQDVARDVIVTSARAVAAVDQAEASAYRDAARRALEASADLPAYRAAMEPHDAIEQALRATAEALRSAERVVDAWTYGSEEQWLPMAACLVVAIDHLAQLLRAADVPIPDEVSGAIALGAQYARAACPSPE